MHWHQAYPGPLPGGGETPRGKGGKVVVVTSGDAVSGSMGGRRDRRSKERYTSVNGIK